MTSKKTKPLYFRLVNDEVRDNCVKTMFLAHQDSEEVLEVVIRPEQRKRSLAQNRLYWKWVSQWAEHTGDSEQRAHHIFKYKFLVTIFYRDDSQYAAMCDSVKVLKGIDRGHYDKIAAHVIRQTSTTDASVKQMTEYLDRVERYCYANDFILTTPQELQWVRETEQGK